MSRTRDHLDVDELMRAIDPCSDEPSSAESTARITARAGCVSGDATARHLAPAFRT
jgi:hypothetical protein